MLLKFGNNITISILFLNKAIEYKLVDLEDIDEHLRRTKAEKKLLPA